jgi:hypothetical protein
MVHPEGVIAIVAAFGLATYVIRTGAQIYLKRLELKRGAPFGSDTANQRLERIEQAVDAIAIEMERVSEGQRFTTKLLAERVAQPPSTPPAPPAGSR